jgi:hypothetical protein
MSNGIDNFPVEIPFPIQRSQMPFMNTLKSGEEIFGGKAIRKECVTFLLNTELPAKGFNPVQNLIGHGLAL